MSEDQAPYRVVPIGRAELEANWVGDPPLGGFDAYVKMHGQPLRFEAMNTIEKTCPCCTCTIFEQSGERTADGHSAWQDTDGTWYNGPARETTTRRCAHCGWKQVIERRRGKLLGVTSDPVELKTP